jgi:ferric-dicitrate binding protein FerR (iron transport regulator)
MGQAKQRGTFEQRRQRAIAKAMPDASPAQLNEAYKSPRRALIPHLSSMLALAAIAGSAWRLRPRNGFR